MTNVSLPHNWRARHYQRDLFKYMFSGGSLEGKRAVCVWHRRAGKDSCSLNLAAVASQMRVGTIWHMLPTARQGRKVIWDGIDRDGRRMIRQAFPDEIIRGINNTEMKVEFNNGSIYQVVGSDNFDALVGTNPVGVIFSEYSIADPTAWDYVRPILAENGGWAVFIYTFRGKNHGWKLSEMARKNPGWFHSIKTVDDTYRCEELPGDREQLAKIPNVISRQAVDDERKAGMGETTVQQEFYCCPDSGLEGAFYTEELRAMRNEGRVGSYPWNPGKLCQTFWDIGRDMTVIGITQEGEDGGPVLIDCLAGRNTGLPEWLKRLDNLPYQFDEYGHVAPHDMGNVDWAVDKTRKEIAAGLGYNFNVLEKTSLQDGVEACRLLLRRMRVNEDTCENWLNGIAVYRREYDERRGVFKDTAVHADSHFADMTRYMAMGWDEYKASSSQFRQNFKVVRSLR